MDKKIVTIAKDNGYDLIGRKLHEEIGELLMTKAKFDTANEAAAKNEDDLNLKLSNIERWKSELAGEIADVKVMLDQITYFLGLEQEVQFDYNFKIQRQLNRIRGKGEI